MNGPEIARWFGHFGCLMALAVIGLGVPGPAAANQFATAITVNDRAVTQYELDQRLLFMQILRQPGDLEEMARTGLIEDRLRMFAAEEYGIKLTPDQILVGMNEFASRANLSAEEFLDIVGQAGVQPETYRDFVEAGMIWREVVRAKFAGQVRITEAEIDRALANYKPTTVVKVLLSEIVISAKGGERSSALALARRLKGQILTEDDFSAAARGNSAGPTAGGGGRLGWQRLSELPEAAIPVVRALAIGQVSAPVELEDSIVLYQLRELGEDKLGAVAATVVDYAQFLVPEGDGAAAEIAKVRANSDTCDDLYKIAKDLPAERLLRDSKPLGEVPGDIAAALAVLDAGEASSTLRRGGWRVFLMLCSRGASPELLPSRDQVQEQLLNQRLGAKADIYLEELRSEAVIVEQ
jgi:peptidyl-prolyl cis-trans isomerase SurA